MIERVKLSANAVSQVIDKIKHSTAALRELPPEVQLPARIAYYDGIRAAFLASTAIASAAVVASIFARGRGLQRPD